MSSIRCEFREGLEKEVNRLIAKADKVYDDALRLDLEREIDGINVALDACIACSTCGIQANYRGFDEGRVTIREQDCPEACG